MLYKQIEQNKRNTWLAIGGYVLILGAAAWFIDYLTDTMAISCFFLGAGLIYLAYIYFDATRHLMKITGAHRRSARITAGRGAQALPRRAGMDGRGRPAGHHRQGQAARPEGAWHRTHQRQSADFSFVLIDFFYRRFVDARIVTEFFD